MCFKYLKHDEICTRLLDVINIFNVFSFKFRHEFEYNPRHLLFFLYSHVWIKHSVMLNYLWLVTEQKRIVDIRIIVAYGVSPEAVFYFLFSGLLETKNSCPTCPKLSLMVTCSANDKLFVSSLFILGPDESTCTINFETDLKILSL